MSKRKPELTPEVYENELDKLQVELSYLQRWVRHTGARIVIIFEGRDAAGKGGVIKTIMQRLSPRIFKTVALPTPTEREKTQYYLQRYIKQLPAAGEVVLFDRSWYNRAGVEHVMGFCTDEEYKRFLSATPDFEKSLVDEGIILIKYFLEIDAKTQEKRFKARMKESVKHWKLSPMDMESWRRFDDYTEAYAAMIRHTDTHFAPWYRLDSNHKKIARLSCISHMLSLIPYEHIPFDPPEFPEKHKHSHPPAEPSFRFEVPEYKF